VDRCLNGRASGCGIGNVERDRTRAVAVFQHQAFKLLRAASGRDHPVPVVEHRLGEFPPEATRTARDEPGLCHE
jgi:hypothetical protein